MMSKLKQITLILENLDELEVPVIYLKTLELDHVKESHHLRLADDEIGKLYEVASLKVAIDNSYLIRDCHHFTLDGQDALQRLLFCPDITGLNLEYADGQVDYYQVAWGGDSDTINAKMKVVPNGTDAGSTLITINDDNNDLLVNTLKEPFQQRFYYDYLRACKEVEYQRAKAYVAKTSAQMVEQEFSWLQDNLDSQPLMDYLAATVAELQQAAQRGEFKGQKVSLWDLLDKLLIRQPQITDWDLDDLIKALVKTKSTADLVQLQQQALPLLNWFFHFDYHNRMVALKLLTSYLTAFVADWMATHQVNGDLVLTKQNSINAQFELRICDSKVK